MEGQLLGRRRTDALSWIFRGISSSYLPGVHGRTFEVDLRSADGLKGLVWTVDSHLVAMREIRANWLVNLFGLCS